MRAPAPASLSLLGTDASTRQRAPEAMAGSAIERTGALAPHPHQPPDAVAL